MELGCVQSEIYIYIKQVVAEYPRIHLVLVHWKRNVVIPTKDPEAPLTSHLGRGRRSGMLKTNKLSALSACSSSYCT
jgi:hypothetical protein